MDTLTTAPGQKMTPPGLVTGGIPPAVQGAITFDQLCQLEPQLAALADEVRSCRVGVDYDELAVWYGWPGFEPGFKRRLNALIGWYRIGDGPSVLFTEPAYVVACQTLLGLLPYATTNAAETDN